MSAHRCEENKQACQRTERNMVMSNKAILLASALAGLAALAVTGAGLGIWCWSGLHRSPSSEGGGSSYVREREPQNIGCRIWRTSSGELFYAIAVAHSDFEPILPAFRYSYSFNINKGGLLTINGETVKWSRKKRLLALGPFGKMREIALSDAEAALVASGDEKKIWESVVLKRLYQVEGKSSRGGERVGHWVCSDAAGKKAYEGAYTNGRRDGEWVYYYPSGSVRARIRYANGIRNGKWTWYDQKGLSIETLTWKNDVPVERPARQGGLGNTWTISPNGNSAGSLGN
jgi:hypothetical protein